MILLLLLFNPFLGEGVHTLWNNYNLATAPTTFESDYFNVYPYYWGGLYFKANSPTNNPFLVKVSVKCAFTTTDPMAYPTDSLGGIANTSTIFYISDTLPHIRSIRFPASSYGRIEIKRLSDGTGVRITVKLRLYK